MMRILLTSLTKKFAVLAAFFLFSAGAFAQVTYTDSVCAGSQDVVYGITGASAGSHYYWWLAQGSGTVDSTIVANDSVIEIDWGISTGTDTLYAQEIGSDGCLGDTVTLVIVISPLPTVAVVGDTICPGTQANLTFQFTGTAPWIVEYTDGSTTFTDTAGVSPYVVSLPPYQSDQLIDVTSLSDANGCVADTSGLPTGTPIITNPLVSTGSIYHY